MSVVQSIRGKSLMAAALAATLIGGFGGIAAAQSNMLLSRAIYVERLSEDGSGKRVIEPANTLRRGDKVVLLVEWRTPSGVGRNRSLTVSSKIPSDLAFQDSSLRLAQVSVDGGRNWGALSNMTIHDQDGARRASVEDVTNLRWKIPGGSARSQRGRITYSAIVR